jgi:hypothetical protein
MRRAAQQPSLGAPTATHEAPGDLAETINGTVLPCASRPSEAVSEYHKAVSMPHKPDNDNPKMNA